MQIRYKVTLDFDPDTECPASFEGAWAFYSFGKRKTTDAPRNRFVYATDKPKPGYAAKVRAGLAWPLDYYESSERWARAASFERADGILVWEHAPTDMGAKTIEERGLDADAFLAEYSEWARGDAYCYSIEKVETTEDGFHRETHVDSCGGLIGPTYFLEELRSNLPADASEDNVEFVGAAAFLVETIDFFKGQPA